MNKNLLFALSLSLPCVSSFAQNVNIPDANFKNYLLNHPLINTNSDTEIQVSEAVAFTGDIQANNLGISDLTGVESFTSLNALYCRDNNLGSINVSANTVLTYLDCQNTNISALDLSTNTQLGGLTCALNSLTSLNLSNNTSLAAINCSGNSLSTLNVSSCPLLSNFSCDNNNLTTLDVSNNPALSYFVCNFNSLASLDLSNNSSLNYLACTGNNLSSLDLSNNSSLTTLFCGLNSIDVLDLSSNGSLVSLTCSNNNLQILQVANGNNSNFFTFNSSGNPNLTCIQVDDVAYSNANWTNIDAASSFSLDCDYPLAVNENEKHQELEIYPNPATTFIQLKSVSTIISIQLIDAFGKSISVSLNGADSIDLSKLTKGVYFLLAETENGFISKKFVKE